jgi:hypothetical protein
MDRSAKDAHVLLMIQGSPLPHAAGEGCGWCDAVRDVDTNGPSAFERNPWLETIMQLDGRRPGKG